MRYEVENTDGVREVSPLMGKDNNISYTRDNERRYDFKKEIKEITFQGDDFKYFLSIEQGDDRCKLHTFRIYNDCQSQLPDDLKFTGTFSSSDGKWDIDRCTVKFKVKNLDDYTCMDDSDDDINLFDLGLDTYSVDMGITIGYVYDTEERVGDTYFYKDIIMYLICPCDYDPGDAWTLFDACDGTTKRYIREIPQLNNGGKIVYDSNFHQIDNGFDLKEALQALLDETCGGGTTIVSEFFQWNAPYPSDINYVTGELNKYKFIRLFQKSDVKRPNVSNNATKAETTFKKLLEAVCKTYNLGYQNRDGEFRIEHISWFEKNLGIDFTKSKKNEFRLKGTRKYSYDAQKLPKFEKFSFMEAGSADFVGADIWYDSNCVNNDEENKSENSTEIITTDVMYCIENGDSESENVSDDGFVLIACDEEGNILYEPGILDSAAIINNTLSWAHLHRDLWKHGRVLEEGYLNNELTEFASTVPTIKQDKFNVLLECFQIRSFEPLDQLRSTLGWGFIQAAELSLIDCTLTIDMNLEKIVSKNPEDVFGDFDSDFDPDFD
ncbi:hypothetical protein C7S20_00005 [Christiangramia fulva]|uniref:Uncharacterized protein n=1 Tax=Christiangramia fulva TaxID=2126553 RepID=A0A2R3ZAH6_9FLAO|nr:hypothetical protein [Christiangramia fulva]AVR47261.1 hypothetical protein C7S20_00005 [Christiangramia fulva]